MALERGESPTAKRDRLLNRLRRQEDERAGMDRAFRASGEPVIYEGEIAPNVIAVGTSKSYSAYDQAGWEVFHTRQELREAEELVEGFSRF